MAVANIVIDVEVVVAAIRMIEVVVVMVEIMHGEVAIIGVVAIERVRCCSGIFNIARFFFHQGDGRSARGGYGNWDEQKNAANAESNESGKTFSGWTASRAPAVKFEAGDSFPSIQIPKDVVKLVVSHIETPNDFFVQSISNESAIVKLSENMQADSKTAPEIDFNSAKPDQVCLAKSSDGCWYRGRNSKQQLPKFLQRRPVFSDCSLHQCESNESSFCGLWRYNRREF